MVKQLLLQTWDNIKCGAAQFYPFKNHGQWVTSGGLGTMGFGIPSSIGAKLANPDKTVVCFVGDGGFQMTNQEMAL